MNLTTDCGDGDDLIITQEWEGLDLLHPGVQFVQVFVGQFGPHPGRCLAGLSSEREEVGSPVLRTLHAGWTHTQGEEGTRAGKGGVCSFTSTKARRQALLHQALSRSTMLRC